MSTTLFRQRKANVSAREAPCQTRNSTKPWPRSEPARIPENNVENIQEEIKSYLSSALELFGQLPSRPITTGHPGTQSYQAESSRVVVSQGTTPQSSCLPINYPSLVEAQETERERKTVPRLYPSYQSKMCK